MLISFDGLPGSQKKLIYLALEKHNVRVKCQDDEITHTLFQSDLDKYSLAYEFDRLYKLNQQLLGDNKNEVIHCYDSFHSLREIYVELLYQKKHLDIYQMEVFQRYHDILLLKKPDYIIYFFGMLDNTFKRTEKGGLINSFDDYKMLHYQYEWVFDITNCKIPMFKVSIEDDLENIVSNILHILRKIEMMHKNLPSNVGVGGSGVGGVGGGGVDDEIIGDDEMEMDDYD